MRRRKPLVRRTRLRYRSKKTQRRYVERRALLLELSMEPTPCEVPWCGQRAEDPHEPKTRARGGSIVDRKNIKLICHGHHRQIHDQEPDWAYALGFLVHSWEAS
jgi:hypothetical protein